MKYGTVIFPVLWLCDSKLFVPHICVLQVQEKVSHIPGTNITKLQQ